MVVINMGVDWNKFKEVTLWTYEELIDKLELNLSYNFVKKYYDMKFKKLRPYLKYLFKREDEKYEDYHQKVTGTFREIEVFGVQKFSELLQTIPDRSQFLSFIQISSIEFEDMVRVLHCILRWILPFSRPIRQFVDKNRDQLSQLSILRTNGVKSNLDMIENYSNNESRKKLVQEIEIPMEFVITLLQKTDLSRLPWTSGKTVKILFQSGYTTLQKLASSNLETVEERVRSYVEGEGKRYSRSFLDLEMAINQAAVLPSVIEL